MPIDVPHPTFARHDPAQCRPYHWQHWTPRRVACVTRVVFRINADGGLRVERCESNFRRWERSWAGALGPWQVIPRYHPDAPRAFDVVRITRWVYRVTRHGTDWSSWVCQP